ncbi:MAG TPA: hypothetical protein VND20_02615 [Candidatus Binataceae bacterium]|nr:hypothetical protein [Candidatus Binataceae bacterium]
MATRIAYRRWFTSARGALAAVLCALTVLIGASATLVTVARPASAGQVQVLPSQQRPAVGNRPNLSQSQTAPDQSTTIPFTPGGAGSNTREIPLPEVFRGCWTGLVSEVDSITPLSPDATHIQWLTKSYTLCYKQVGYAGKWQLTFAEGSVAERAAVSDQRQSISVKSVEGRDRAELTAYLHFRAPQVDPIGIATGTVNTLDELTHLHCAVTPDKSAMDVRATVFVENDGESWATIVWHTRFMRVGAGD